MSIDRHIDVPRHWRLRKQRYQLVGEICGCCDAKIFPPRDLCPSCGDKTKKPYNFSGMGEVYSMTTISPDHVPADFKRQAPYTVALIKLEEGPLVTAQLTDIDPKKPPEIGTPVQMVIRKLKEYGDRGMIVYGYKFRPLLVT